MILRDRITVLVRTQPLDEYGNPAEDAYGNPLPPVNVESPTDTRRGDPARLR